MRQLPRVLLPALLTFVAGMFAGLMLAPRLSPPPTGILDSDLLAWEESMSINLELDREQRADMRVLLAYYQRERNKLFAAQRNEVEPQLVDLDERFEGLIRDRVLTPKQRTRIIAMVAGDYADASFPYEAAPR